MGDPDGRTQSLSGSGRELPEAGLRAFCNLIGVELFPNSAECSIVVLLSQAEWEAYSAIYAKTWSVSYDTS